MKQMLNRKCCARFAKHDLNSAVVKYHSQILDLG